VVAKAQHQVPPQVYDVKVQGKTSCSIINQMFKSIKNKFVSLLALASSSTNSGRVEQQQKQQHGVGLFPTNQCPLKDGDPSTA